MRTESHGISIHTRDDRFHSAIVKKVLNRICIACFYRHGYTDVFSIWNLIFCIFLSIPEFKFIGFKDRSILFIGKLVVITSGNTELHIPRKVNTGYCDSITGMILYSSCSFLRICQISSRILRTFIFCIVFSVKNIILVIFRFFCDLWDFCCIRGLCYLWSVIFIICFTICRIRICGAIICCRSCAHFRCFCYFRFLIVRRIVFSSRCCGCLRCLHYLGFLVRFVLAICILTILITRRICIFFILIFNSTAVFRSIFLVSALVGIIFFYCFFVRRI